MYLQYFLIGWVKYSMFAFNFVFWMFGALLMGIGTYAAIENWKQGQGNSGTITLMQRHQIFSNLVY